MSSPSTTIISEINKHLNALHEKNKSGSGDVVYKNGIKFLDETEELFKELKVQYIPPIEDKQVIAVCEKTTAALLICLNAYPNRNHTGIMKEMIGRIRRISRGVNVPLSLLSAIDRSDEDLQWHGH